MYPIPLPALRSALPGGAGRTARVTTNVLCLGVTSLLTDISSEMVVSVLPLYLMLELQLSPAAFGAIEGLHHGGASLLRILSGVIADRSRRYQRIAALGYGISALSKLGLLVTQSALGLGLVTLFDRLGKGLRTSPRDTLISLSAAPDQLGRAFGVHRTLDAAGALLGPLLAFALLRLAPSAYDAVFVVSALLAALGVAVIVTFVRDPALSESAGSGPREALGLLALSRLLSEQKGFRALVAGAMALGMATISDGFIYLMLTRERELDLDASYVPLLYVATPAVYMLLALPLGKIADRIGRTWVFLLGYGCLFGCYAGLLAPLGGVPKLLLVVGLLGAFYAATDGVLMALASALLRPESRATGIGVLSTAHQVGRMLAALGFGLLWARSDAQLALLAFSVGGLLITGWVHVLLRGLAGRPAHG